MCVVLSSGHNVLIQIKSKKKSCSFPVCQETHCWPVVWELLILSIIFSELEITQM